MQSTRHLFTSSNSVLCRPSFAHVSRLTQTISPLQSNPLQSRLLSTATVHQVQSGSKPQRDAQKDREKINTESNEYAKSSTDDAAAGQGEAAFDPNITDPQKEKEKAGQGNKGNPLDVSPANVEISTKPAEKAKGPGTK